MIDEAREMKLWSGAATSTRPRFSVDEGGVVIPVQNIGAGPALDLTVAAAARSEEGKHTREWGDKWPTDGIPGLGVSQVAPALLRVGGADRTLPSFDVYMAYSDVAGKRWVTTAIYETRWGLNRYLAVSIKPGDSVEEPSST
jgi:hypothetical protein